jgi:hypothetical protein
MVLGICFFWDGAFWGWERQGLGWIALYPQQALVPGTEYSCFTDRQHAQSMIA